MTIIFKCLLVDIWIIWYKYTNDTNVMVHYIVLINSVVQTV